MNTCNENTMQAEAPKQTARNIESDPNKRWENGASTYASATKDSLLTLSEPAKWCIGELDLSMHGSIEHLPDFLQQFLGELLCACRDGLCTCLEYLDVSHDFVGGSDFCFLAQFQFPALRLVFACIFRLWCARFYGDHTVLLEHRHVR